MSVYSILVFLHITGALGLFVGIGLEWAGIANLRRARTTGQAGEWVRLLKALRLVEAPAALTVLATGLYMGATVWGHRPWIAVGLLGMVVMAALGIALTRPRVATISSSLPGENVPISTNARRRIDDPVLRLASRLRTSLALGVVFIMTVKPASTGTLAAMGVATALGLASGIPAWTRGRTAIPNVSHSTES